VSTAHPDDVLSGWDGFVGAAAVGGDGVVSTWGDLRTPVRWASVSKLVVAFGALVAVEEGTMGLDDAAGPTGATVEDLLAHSSGLAFDSDEVLAAPRTRRIYSNTGFERLATHLADAAGMPWEDYVSDAVVAPLGMRATEVGGSPAKDLRGTVDDLIALTRELLSPTLVDATTLEAATTTHFGDLDGVLPGVGPQRPNPWGLGFEIRGHKSPHWTGDRNSPATFGHFGGSGTFLWVDPDLGLALVALGTHEFGPWALDVWPRFSDAVIAQVVA
jgi:CubicO group peptidase (beta-lactamase class C family)